MGRHKSHLLHDVDVDDVMSTIAHHEHSISKLDSDIAQHLQTIRQLQFKKQEHLDRIRECKGRITLARRIPSEILAYIFEDCVRNGWTKTPLTVSHVCVAWRKAAQIPTVWSRIYVYLDAIDPYERTAFWLKQSQNTALDIDLEVGNDTAHFGSIMGLLLTQKTRWRSVTLKSVYLDSANKILRLCRQSFPRLRSVNVSIAEEFPQGPHIENESHQLFPLNGAFLESSDLRHFHVDRNLLPSPNIIPSTIVDLQIRLSGQQSSQSSCATILDVVANLPRLSSLSLEIATNAPITFLPELDQTRFVGLPELRSLTLAGSGVSVGVFDILRHLNLPTVSCVRLRSSFDRAQPEDLEQWLRVFFRQPLDQLEILELREFSVGSKELEGHLQHIPNLKGLYLHDSDINDVVLARLNGPGGLCPLLERIDIRWCGNLTGAGLVKLVESRLLSPLNDQYSSAKGHPKCKPIKEVTAINCSFIKEEDIIRLASMTVCRLIMRNTDICYSLGCCRNERYRRRMWQRLLQQKIQLKEFAQRQLVV